MRKNKKLSPPLMVAKAPPAQTASAVAHSPSCGCATCKPGAQAGTTKVPVPPRRLCAHRGEPVRVGRYEIMAGGTRDLLPEDLEKADLLVPLLEAVPFAFGKRYEILAAPLVDFGGVPKGWGEFVQCVADELALGRKILTFCMGGHGRTGTMLASLIAVLETAEETPDPIAAVRARHCSHAVETLAQAEAIFALRGKNVPAFYRREFQPKYNMWSGQSLF